MTTKLEMPTYDAKRLAEIFECPSAWFNPPALAGSLQRVDLQLRRLDGEE